MLYTEGRHPKDIVRSFSHEMVHHIQNLEGRLGNITTTNTQEDDNLNDIEAEANLKGTMTFRNWTDSLNEISLPKATQQISKLNPEVDAEEVAKDFIRLSPNLDKKDLFQYSTYDELKQELDKVSQTKSQRRKQAKSMDLEDNKLIFYKDDNFTIYKLDDPSQHPESCEIAQGAKICVASNSKKYWNQYMIDGDGVLFYIRNKKHDIPHPQSVIAFMFPRKGLKIGYTEMVDYNDDDFIEHGNYEKQKEYLSSIGIPSNVIEKMFKFVPEVKPLSHYIEQYKGKKKKIKVEGKEYFIFSPQTPPGMETIVFEDENGKIIGDMKGNEMWAFIKLNPLERKWIKNKFPNIPESPIGIRTKTNRYFDENAREIDLYTIQNNKLVKTGEASLPYNNDQLKILLSGGTLEIPERFKNSDSLNEYNNSGPSTPKVYIVKDDGTYKEAPIELLSKISNLTYDMGGGETNYYPAKNIVIVDNIPVEEFAKEPGDIKGEKVYVEYNLNNPTSLPKANKIIASQLVYHLDNREAFAQTVANSLKDGGTFEFQSDLMNKKDKMFLQHLSDEYGFGLPTKLNQYKQESLPLKKGEFVEPIISYIYKITDKDDKTSTLSVTKKGKWWEYEKIDGDLDFKTGKFSTPPIDPDPNFRDKKYTLRTFDKYLSFFGDSNTIVDFEELNEANKPYKHKHGFDDKLGNDPFGLNQYARELAQGLEEAIVGDKIECDNCGWSWNIEDGGDDLYTCHKCWHDNTPKQLNEGRYDTLANKLSSIAFEAFKDIHDRGDKEGSFKFRVDHPDDEHDIPSKDFYFDFEGVVEITDDEYGVDGGANAGFDNEGDEITPLLSVKFKIPKNPDWQKVSFDIKDVVRHELEHLTQDGYNEKTGKYMEDDQLLRDLIDADMLSKSAYFRLEKEVDAMLQGLYFKAKKSKRPFKDVIDDYLNIFIDQETITQEEKENILDIWRSRGKSLSLPLFEQMKDMDYEIYSDMDGVLTDFDAQFMKASDGILPSEYEKNFGKDGFWELIDGKGVGYWVGMPWMPDGKTYWDYIKKYTPILLSSPSRSQTSRLGKRLWVRNNMPGTKLILAQAKDKQNYAQKNRILIDDRPSNIDQWRASGGIGILHTSASDTIRQLKELGL